MKVACTRTALVLALVTADWNLRLRSSLSMSLLPPKRLPSAPPPPSLLATIIAECRRARSALRSALLSSSWSTGIAAGAGTGGGVKIGGSAGSGGGATAAWVMARLRPAPWSVLDLPEKTTL